MSFSPQKFGRYYVYDKLAVGGMAEIFKARLCGSKDFQKKFVIKRLNVGKRNRDYLTKLFIDEAHLCSNLSHSNVVHTYDFSMVENRYFIAMEYVEGQDLKQLLIRSTKNRELLNIDTILFIIHEICSGLHYIHNHRTPSGERMDIVHRDLSPANILISYNADIKIADFGIAKNTHRLFQSDPGIRKGKHEYMSPEQASCTKIDHRSDVFCVGIILYELLTGRRLFQSSSDVQALQKVQTCSIPQASSINPRIPPRLNQIVHTALQKNPALRFQSAEQFRKAIKEIIHPQTIFGAKEELYQIMDRLFKQEKEEERLEEKQVQDVLQNLEKETKINLPKDDPPVDNAGLTTDNEKVLDYPTTTIIPWLTATFFFLLWVLSLI